MLTLPLPDSIFGFHGQQAFEKLLKALLSAHLVEYPLTHNLSALMRLLRTCDELLPELPYELVRLQPYAVEMRYEFGGEIDEAEREAIRVALTRFRHHVLERSLQLEEIRRAGA